MAEATYSAAEGEGTGNRAGGACGDATPAATAESTEGNILGAQALALLGLLAVAGIVGTSTLIQSHVSATQRQAPSSACAVSSGSYLERLDQAVRGTMHRYSKLRGPLMAGASPQPD